MRVTRPGAQRFQSPADGAGRARHRITVIDVACPACLAQPGEKCLTATGGELAAYHTPRRRMATRAANAIPGRELLLGLEATTPAQRKRIRENAGVTQKDLKAILKRADAHLWETVGPKGSLPKGEVAIAYAALLNAWQGAGA